MSPGRSTARSAWSTGSLTKAFNWISPAPPVIRLKASAGVCSSLHGLYLMPLGVFQLRMFQQRGSRGGALPSVVVLVRV